MFEIDSTASFNTNRLVKGNDFDYVTRTSTNQGILQQTGFVNAENINEAGTWSLGLLQMDFFYRERKWYAGQFVRKITPKFDITPKAASFITAILNNQKTVLLSVLVRHVDETFRNLKVKFPIKNNNLDFDFMENFISELETGYVIRLNAYLKVNGLDNYQLTEEEKNVLSAFSNNKVKFQEFKYKEIFNKIVQGRRLKKDDQLPGKIPFVMSGTTNSGVVNCISNPVASFPKNSITLDIFGNSFYRNYDFGACDDTGVYWNDEIVYSKCSMLFLTAAMGKSVFGKFSYGKKLRSSQSNDIFMQLPVKNGKPDFEIIDILVSAIQKLVIKDVVIYANRRINTLNNNNE